MDEISGYAVCSVDISCLPDTIRLLPDQRAMCHNLIGRLPGLRGYKVSAPKTKITDNTVALTDCQITPLNHWSGGLGYTN